VEHALEGDAVRVSVSVIRRLRKRFVLEELHWLRSIGMWLSVSRSGSVREWEVPLCVDHMSDDLANNGVFVATNQRCQCVHIVAQKQAIERHPASVYPQRIARVNEQFLTLKKRLQAPVQGRLQETRID
jgi:hypothetical protein